MFLEIGIITDIHGADMLPAIAEFNSRRIEYILVNGDLTGKTRESFVKVLYQLAGSLNGTALIIPGSHESASTYASKMKQIEAEFANIKNVHKKTEMLRDNIAVLAYGGATWSPSPDPVLINPLMEAHLLALQFDKLKDKDLIFQLHEPPMGYGDIAEFVNMAPNQRVPLSALENHPKYAEIKTCAKRDHVGDMNLAMLVEGKLADKKPILTTFGHIHESYKFQSPGVEIGSKRDVLEAESVSNLALNPGPYLDGRFSIVEISDQKVSYKILNIKR